MSSRRTEPPPAPDAREPHDHPARRAGRGSSPPAGATGRPTEADLGDLVMRVARTLRHRGAVVTAPWDLAPHQARALRVVARHEEVRPGVLAAHLRVAPRSVTDVVDALEDRGLVLRSPDPTDRRATVVRLTASGRRLVDEIDAARRADAEAYFSRLSERDRAVLRRVLLALDEEP